MHVRKQATAADLNGKQIIFSPLLTLTLAMLAAATFAVWHLDTWMASPVDAPQRSDAIVSLGGDPGTRVR